MADRSSKSDKTSIYSRDHFSSSKRYYDVFLIMFIIGLPNTLYLFSSLRVVGSIFPFLVPYFIFSILIGIPITILELSLGQYGSKDMIHVWDICPIFRGMGALYVFYSLHVLMENNAALSFILRYVINSFSSTSGWNKCDNEWNTMYCYNFKTNYSRRLDCYDALNQDKCDNALWETSYKQYWYNEVLRESFGFIQYKNVLYCCAVSMLTFMLSYKGVYVTEKLNFWLLMISGLLYFAMLFNSTTQYGSGYGLRSIFKADWGKFKRYEPWSEAFHLFICSTGVGSGALINLGSKNEFRGHSYRNGMIVILASLTVTFMSVVLYTSLCGNMHYHTRQTMEEIMQGKEPIYWSKIPRMLEKLNGPTRLWHCMFFTILFIIVLARNTVLTIILAQTAADLYPRIKKHWITTVFMLHVAVTILCVPFYTQYNSYVWKKLIAKCVKGPYLYLMNFLQLVVFIYIYGLTTVIDDMHFMLGFRWPFYWQILLAISPIVMFVAWVVSLVNFKDSFRIYPLKTQREYFIMQVYNFIPFPVIITYALWHTRKLIWHFRWENVFRPTENWFLTDPVLRISRQMFSAMSMTKEYLYRQSLRRNVTANVDMDDEFENDNEI